MEFCKIPNFGTITMKTSNATNISKILGLVMNFIKTGLEERVIQ